MSPVPRLLDALLARWPGQVVRLKSVDSTQDLAKKLAESGAPEWTLVLAERQTRGRGRLGRRWRSPRGGLYLSLVLRPRVKPASLGRLSMGLARAAARAIRAVSGLPTAVKPPNDVLALGPDGPRKVCGILLEASGGSSTVEWVVAGLGVNVDNRVPRSLPAASSLARLAGRPVGAARVARALLTELRKRYPRFR